MNVLMTSHHPPDQGCAMKNTTITIHTTTEPVQVKAKVLGAWAYHRVHPPEVPGYAVTHVPTGRQMPGTSGCSEHAAHATVLALASHPHTSDGNVDPRTGRHCNFIVDAIVDAFGRGWYP